MSIQRLPIEVLETVFQIVTSDSDSKRDILECVKVCQTWYSPACRALYETVFVQNTSKILSSFNIQKEDLGIFCKKLLFLPTDDATDRPTEEYEQLLSHMPNVNTIYLKSCSHRVVDLENLSRYAHLLKHVKEISPMEYYWRHEELQSYYNCVNSFKNTIQRINLFASNANIFGNNGRSENIIPFLSNFHSLTKLYFRNWGDFVFRASRQPSAFSILHSCPKLHSFTYRDEFNEGDVDCADYNFDHSKLRHLEIKIPEIKKDYVMYIVKNITRLDEFHLNDYHDGRPRSTTSVGWIEQFSVEELLLFQKYLTTISKVNFSTDDDPDANVCDHLLFISGILKEKQTLSAHITLAMNVVTDELARISLKKSGNNISFHSGVQLKKFMKIFRADPSIFQNLFTPNIAKNNVKSLQFYFTLQSKEEEEEEELLPFCIELFRFVINYFTGLEKLDITTQNCNEEVIHQIKVSSNDLNDATTNYYTEKFAMTETRRSTIPPSKLDYVLLKNMQCGSNEINTILDLLPNIEYLNLLHFKYGYSKNSEYILNLNNLRIRRLVMNVEIHQLHPKGIKYQSVMLKIEEEDSGQTFCYKWERKLGELKPMEFKAIDMKCEKKLYYPYQTFYVFKCCKIEEICICSEEGIIYTTIHPGH